MTGTTPLRASQKQFVDCECLRLGCREGAPPDDEVGAQGMLEIRDEFDYVLINTASAGSRCDAVVFGRMADGLILVLEASSTRRKVAQTVAEYDQGW